MGKKDPDMIKLNYSNQYEKSIVLTEYSICYRIFFKKIVTITAKKVKNPTSNHKLSAFASRCTSQYCMKD